MKQPARHHPTLPHLGTALLLAVLACSCVTPAPDIYPGEEIRRETLKETHAYSFTVRLAPPEGQHLRFALTKHDLVSRVEVPVYDKIQVFHSEESRYNRGGTRYVPVPGETIRGAPRTTHKSRDSGPLRNTTLLLNGQSVTTDEAGYFVDRSDLILSMLDDPRTTGLDLRFRHETFGSVILPVTRNHILDAIGVPVKRDRQPAGREKISFKLDVPERLHPGETFPITLTVSNQGPRTADRVEGRTVSRHAWLNGRMFYIGAVHPGETRSFRRTFTVPADQPPATVFAALGLWDILGTDPGRTIDLALKIAP